jgi:hypothetical protein
LTKRVKRRFDPVTFGGTADPGRNVLDDANPASSVYRRDTTESLCLIIVDPRSATAE